MFLVSPGKVKQEMCQDIQDIQDIKDFDTCVPVMECDVQSASQLLVIPPQHREHATSQRLQAQQQQVSAQQQRAVLLPGEQPRTAGRKSGAHLCACIDVYYLLIVRGVGGFSW
jgi:hypothetical protein